ncbi:MAG TPA: hypothetical protein VNX68_12865 [Nitrosopumilaceae archaeon]|jgi:hypothetical protein|nr:hypothetical protein [Nitrosopumilaceae archaeon]
MTHAEKEKINLEKQQIEEGKFRFLRSTKKEIKQHKFTPLYHGFDVVFISGDTFCIGETKCRIDFTNKFFSFYGPFLEKNKLDAMIEHRNRMIIENPDRCFDTDQFQLIYFNFTKDGCLIYKLKTTNKDYVWVQRFLPKDNIEPDIKIWKTVTELSNPIEVIKYK